MMFVDMDFDLESDVPVQEQTAASGERAAQWAHENGWSVRIYRTHSGPRLMATDPAPEAVDEKFDAVCTAVGADPLYQELCHIQACFRARLTPKPERCGIEQPKYVFPFSTTKRGAIL